MGRRGVVIWDLIFDYYYWLLIEDIWLFYYAVINPPEGFLSEWWSLFWDVYSSRLTNNPQAPGQAQANQPSSSKVFRSPRFSFFLSINLFSNNMFGRTSIDTGHELKLILFWFSGTCEWGVILSVAEWSARYQLYAAKYASPINGEARSSQSPAGC